jgi:hypothetical protein
MIFLFASDCVCRFGAIVWQHRTNFFFVWHNLTVRIRRLLLPATVTAWFLIRNWLTEIMCLSRRPRDQRLCLRELDQRNQVRFIQP